MYNFVEYFRTTWYADRELVGAVAALTSSVHIWLTAFVVSLLRVWASANGRMPPPSLYLGMTLAEASAVLMSGGSCPVVSLQRAVVTCVHSGCLGIHFQCSYLVPPGPGALRLGAV